MNADRKERGVDRHRGGACDLIAGAFAREREARRRTKCFASCGYA